MEIFKYIILALVKQCLYRISRWVSKRQQKVNPIPDTIIIPCLSACSMNLELLQAQFAIFPHIDCFAVHIPIDISFAEVDIVIVNFAED